MKKTYISPIEKTTFGATVLIKFVRPDLKNPLSIQTLEILEDLFEEASSNGEVTKIVFTGEGDTFAAGANLREVASLNEESVRDFGLRGQGIMQRIYRSEKLTIAAINGFCMGGALDLALSCKRRIAHPKAVFAHPGASLGIITGWGGTQLLPRLVGRKKALELFLTANRIGAEEALEMRLIDLIDPDPLAKSLANL